MRKLIHTIAILSMVVLLQSNQQLSAQSSGDLTLFLFRHAEKMDDSKNPHLNEQGRLRAEALYKMLNNEPISAIYSTPYHRTEETVQPFTDSSGLPIIHYNPKELEVFAEELKTKKGRILVSGHSNTTPQLASLIIGKEVDEIDETVYDNLYIITISEGVAVLTVIKF